MRMFILSAVLALGFFLRAQETLSGNFLFLKDQGRDMLAVKSIVVDKKLTLIGPYTGLQAVFQGPLYYYLLGVPFALSGGDPRAVMYLILAASVVAIPLVYVTGKKFFSEEVGLFAAFLFAVSPAAAAAATFIWSPFFALPIMTGALFAFLDWVKNNSRKSCIILACTSGLLFHFETAFAAPFTIAVLLVSWIFATDRRRFPIFLFLGTVILFLSPLLAFDFRHDHITLRSLFEILKGSGQGLGGGEPYGKVIGDHIVRFVLNLNATFIEGKIPAAIFSFVSLLPALLYAARGKSQLVKALLFLPPTLFFVYLFYPFQIWDWYLIGLFPVYLLLGALLLARLWRYPFGRAVVVVVVAILSQSSFLRLERLYRIPDYGGTFKMRGKIEAIDAIYQDTDGKPFDLRVFTPVVLTDAYDYLVWWHGQKTYGYLPGNAGKGILYLLIEPDPSKPWSYQGWLETLILKGNILETRELPSGFIIQKRQI